MRVAIVVWPAPAHLYPLVPLAWAIRSAGHDVVVVSHPSIAGLATAQGLPFAALCEADAMAHPMGPGGVWAEGRADVGRITAELGEIPWTEIGTWITFSQFLLPTMWDFLPYKAAADQPLPAMEGLVGFFEGWHPDLVVWDPVMPGAAVAARKVGARHARYTGPDYCGAGLDMFARLTRGRQVDNPLVETIKPMAERYGVPVDRETLYGQWTINPMPPAINLPVDTRMVPVQWIPHVTQAPVPAWLYRETGRPRIAVSLGVSTREYIKADWSHVGMLLEALGELDVEVVATLNAVQTENVEKVPANVRILDYFPLDQLMPTCDLVIHHGGLATMVTAGHFRTPQIVVDFLEFPIGAAPNEDGTVSGSRYPLAPVTGAFVTGHGAGQVMDLSRPSVAAIREQVEAALGSKELKDGARRLHEDLVLSPTPADLVPIIENLVRPA